MASGHVNRTKGRTHGSTDQACDVKISLANPEPSTHGTFETCRLHRAMSAFRGNPEVSVARQSAAIDPFQTSTSQAVVPFLARSATAKC
jgi:hypothetical protein